MAVAGGKRTRPGWERALMVSALLSSMVGAVVFTVAPESSAEAAAGDDPIPVDDFYSTPADQELVVSATNGLLSNDTLPDPAVGYGVFGHSEPSKGTLLLNGDGSFTYTPYNYSFGYLGEDTFDYTVCDEGEAFCANGTVTVTVESPYTWSATGECLSDGTGDPGSETFFLTLTNGNDFEAFFYVENGTDDAFTGLVPPGQTGIAIGNDNGGPPGSFLEGLDGDGVVTVWLFDTPEGVPLDSIAVPFIDCSVPPAITVEALPGDCMTSPVLRVTNNTEAQVDIYISLQEPPLGGGFGNGSVPPLSSEDFNLNQVPFDEYAFAVSVMYFIDGAFGGITEPILAPPGCLLRPWQEIVDSGCVGGDFTIDIANYTTYGEMAIEVEGNGSVVVSSGQTESVVGADIDGDGFVSTKQTGPIPGERPTVDVPYQDCSIAVWPDFDGDGSADRSVWRPEVGGWYADGQATEFLGLPGDVPVPGDYDGDGTTERAVYRNGAWFVQGRPTVYFGLAGDVPVPGDYDGDGVWEPAVFRDGVWLVEGQAPEYFGSPGDVPVPADYDGDRSTDIAIFRSSVGGWYVQGQAPAFFGLSSDVPVPGDYDGDGTADFGVYRPEVGGWYVQGQSTQFIGLSSDVPLPADYDGDGAVERAVYRPEVGGWYVEGASPVFYGVQTDVPLPSPAAIYWATDVGPGPSGALANTSCLELDPGLYRVFFWLHLDRDSAVANATTGLFYFEDGPTSAVVGGDLLAAAPVGGPVWELGFPATTTASGSITISFTNGLSLSATYDCTG